MWMDKYLPSMIVILVLQKNGGMIAEKFFKILLLTAQPTMVYPYQK